MTRLISIPQQIRRIADSDCESLALLDTDGASVTYEQLQEKIDQLIGTLRAKGIQPQHRIAIALPNGIEAVVSLLSVLSLCAAVPVNPSSRLAELESLCSQFKVDALLKLRDGKSSLSFPALPSGAAGETCKQEPEEMQRPALLLGTSGTTARPKIVPLTHKNLAVSANDLRGALQLNAHDRCLNLMSLHHRSGISATICSLIAGGSVILPPGFSSVQFFEWLDRYRPTWYAGVPAMHQSILARASQCKERHAGRSLRFIRSSSASLPVTMRRELQTVFSVPVIQTYNATETGLIAATPFTLPPEKFASVGKPAGGESVILNPEGEILKAGETGEIAVRGDNVIRGYESDPEANQRHFLRGWFRTGDIGYLDEDQFLYLTGRASEIINRGGQKISPQEIEEVIQKHAAVLQVAAFSLPDPELQEILACAIVLRPEARVTEHEIQTFAEISLSDYKIPARVFFCAALPRTITGKVNRRILQKQFADDRNDFAKEEGLRRLEHELAAIWMSVLQVENVTPEDRFFQIGGDSLLATQLVNRLQQLFNIDISIRAVFQSSTIRQQAQYIAALRRQNISGRSPISRVPDAKKYPVSFPQQRLWFLYRLNPESPVYNIAKQLIIRGPLNVVALQNALRAIVRRHESLRTTFEAIDGTPFQIVNDTGSLEIPVHDLSALDPQKAQMEIERFALQDANKPFQLDRDLMVRATILKRSEHEHALLLTNHHIVSDRWSTTLFFDELQRYYQDFYDGAFVEPPQLPIQYRDFASYQRASMQTPEFERQLSYWKTQLADAPVLNLPGKWSSRAPADFRGAKELFFLPSSLAHKIHSFCKQEDVTAFVFYFSVLQLLMRRHSGQDDILVGTPISGRFQVETENLLGFFANTLVIRNKLPGDPSFRELLHHTRRVVLDAFANKDVPFEKVVETLNPARSGGHSPLFDVIMSVFIGARKFRFADLEIEARDVYTGTAKFPLTFAVEEALEALVISFHYNTSIFERNDIHRMLIHLGNLLQAAVEIPQQCVSEMRMLNDEERELLLEKWSMSSIRCDTDRCIHTIFEEVAAQRPHDIALQCGAITWSYEELNGRANRLAHYLRSKGISTETPVGIFLDRSPSAIVSMLAILKAGGAYAPLETDYPEERIDHLLRQADIRFVVTEEKRKSALPHSVYRIICVDADLADIEGQSDRNPVTHSSSGNLCYILYTSGSTGKPKPVGTLHRGVVRIAKGLDFLKVTEKDRFLHHSTLSFDASTFEIWTALLNGCCLVIPEEKHLSLQQFNREIRAKNISILWLTAPLFAQMMEHSPENLQGLRCLLAGGDVLSVRHVAKAREALPDTMLINAYGPTECTTFACCNVISGPTEGAVPIGRPVANTTVFILDDTMQPAPVGVMGHLYIGGDGLARGYINDDELTETKFVRNPYSNEAGSRLYATGDLARWLPDGTVGFAGRIDNQVKIRGFRVEPAEVEFALREHRHVRDCVVVPEEDAMGEKMLIAYAATEGDATVDELMAHLRCKLPRHMLPARLLVIDSLPLTQAGKVDRRALPQPAPYGDKPANTFIEPHDELELQLSNIWSDVLNVARIGVTDDFFQMGGHSLLAVQLFAEMHKRMGRELPLSALFDHPTVEGLANLLRKEATPPAMSSLVPIRPGGSKPPLFSIHGAGGNILIYRELAEHLPGDQPFYGLQARGLNGKERPLRAIEDMAASYLAEIRNLQPHGPYFLSGVSLGGLIAFEMAHQLIQAREEVRFLALFDSGVTRWISPKPKRRLRRRLLRPVRKGAARMAGLLRDPSSYSHLKERSRDWRYKYGNRFWRILFDLWESTGLDLAKRIRNVERLNFYAFSNYRPKPYAGKITLFKAAEKANRHPTNGWGEICPNVEVCKVPGDHNTLLKEPNVNILAGKLIACLASAQEPE